MLGKLGNVILWFYSDPLYGVLFVVVCLRNCPCTLHNCTIKSTPSLHSAPAPTSGTELPGTRARHLLHRRHARGRAAQGQVGYVAGRNVHGVEPGVHRVRVAFLGTVREVSVINCVRLLIQLLIRFARRRYTLNNLKFGKIDLTRHPNAATKYKINTHALSKQLPTLILFKGGKEYMRRPYVTDKNKLTPFSFSFVRDQADCV